MNDLTDKVVILTGGGGGIGSATAEKLAQNRMKVVLLGGSNLKNLQAAQTAVNKHSECMILPGDLTDADFIAENIAKVIEKFGAIDVLVNNAGVAQSTPFEAISLAEFDKIMAINLRAPFMLIQAVLPYLKKSDTATVINIAKHLFCQQTCAAGHDQKSCSRILSG